MINEKQLAELRRQMMAHPGRGCCPAWSAFDELADTLDKLWRVRRSASRWARAVAGRESIEAESEMMRHINAMGDPDAMERA